MMARRRTGRVLLIMAAPLLLAAVARHVIRWERPAFASGWARAHIARTPAPQEQQPAAAQAAPQRVRITVDATRTFVGPSGDAAAVCGMPGPPAGEPAWPGLGGQRIPAESTVEQVPVYGARLPSGVAVLVANRTGEKADFDVDLRLPRGAYTVERTVFGLKDGPAAAAGERLESALLPRPASLAKPGWLNPGEAALYRFVDSSSEAAAAFREAKGRVRALRPGHAAEYRRLMGPLSECENYVAALSGALRGGRRSDLLKNAHRALLTLAHAQSLCLNSQGKGRTGEAGSGGGIEQALNRLQTALTEVSMGCLGLVPNLAIESAQEAAAQRHATVSLMNAGGDTVAIVKLGMSAPSGIAISPSDEALFRELRPGQTVRAEFAVQVGEQAPEQTVTADVSYIAARAPAHLRLVRTLH